MAITVNLDVETAHDELNEALAALRHLGNTPIKSGDGWMARCPTHEDGKRSLSLTESDTGRLLMHCHAGCAHADVKKRLGIPDRRPPGALSEPVAAPKPRIVATYPYVDEQGDLLFEALRLEPKTFRQRRPDGNGGHTYSLGDTRRVLYQLPLVLDAAANGGVIYVVEGEKDVHAILDHTLEVATCSPMGAGKWRDEYADALTGAAAVIIIADRDAPGYKHAEAIAESLLERGIPHVIKEAAAGKDAHDHLAASHTLDELVDYEPGSIPSQDDAEVRDASEPFTGARVELRQASGYVRRVVRWLPDYEGFIPIGMLTLVAGLQGFGKSLLTCLIAAQETKAGRTVAIASAEDSPEHIIIPRLEAVGANLKLCRIVALTMGDDDSELRLPDHTAALKAAILETRPSVLIVDPISAYLGSNVDSWKDSDVRSALRPLGDLALEADLALLVVAHLNKGAGSTDYLQRVAGNMAFTAAARSALLFGADPTDPDGEKGSQRVLTLGKSNLAPRHTKGRQYRIESVHLSAIPQENIPATVAPKLVYQGEVDISDRQVLGGTEVGSEAVKDAIAFLQEFLADRARPKPEVEEAAKAEGITPKTLREARERLGIVSQRPGFGAPADWSLRGAS